MRQHHINFSDVDWCKALNTQPFIKWFCMCEATVAAPRCCRRTQFWARQDTADIDNSVPHEIFALLEAATQLLALAVLISILEKFFLAGAVRGRCCFETFDGCMSSREGANMQHA